MMSRRGCVSAAIVAAAAALALWFVLGAWFGSGPLQAERSVIVPAGVTLPGLAKRLQTQGIIRSATAFRIGARVFGGGGGIKAGEFSLPRHASASQVLAIISSDNAIRRFVMIPEGMPSIMVQERLMAQPSLTGDIAVPDEGSILPDSYTYANGEPREAVLRRMQAAMTRTIQELWAKRAPGLVVKTPEQALILASIVEKETGKPSERAMVAGLYSNRLKTGMLLQADPTIIYPITRGKPLGRRILQSEIQAVNDYNTYTMVGLPKHPITNPGRASIEAVLHPASTTALYMVADGNHGHVFATTLADHNRNVARWFAFRRAHGI